MKFLLRVAIKGLLLFALLNLLFIPNFERGLGAVSAYNVLFPGRPRLPFGEAPQQAYNFSLFDVEAMFAAHEVNQPKVAGQETGGEYRVLVLGDSSIWGTLLTPEQTLTGQLNALTAQDGLPVRFYNLGYPTISVTKDLMILDRALATDPDLVIWVTTLEALPVDKQLAVPLVENNPERARSLIERYDLPLDAAALDQPTLWERTLIGRRKEIADVLRLQVYGIMWAATGIDQYYPDEYPPAQVDLDPDPTFQGYEDWSEDDLAFWALDAGKAALGDVPLLVVNEPMLISAGANSDIRYNFYYPRGVYDDYRAWMQAWAEQAGVAYLDAWDIVPAEEFTNSAIHLNPAGTARLAELIAEALKR